MAPRELWEEVSCHVLLLWVFSEAPVAAEVTKPGEVDLEQVVKDATWIGFGGLFLARRAVPARGALGGLRQKMPMMRG